MTTTAHTSLAAALSAFQGAVKDPARSRKGQVRGRADYTYVPLDDLLQSVRPLLAAHGLAVSQPVVVEGDRVCLRTILLHTSGERLESTFPLPWSGGAQERGSELTYARRYSLEAVLGVAPSEEDDDGRTAQEERQQRTERRAAPAAATREEPAAEQADRGHHPTWKRAQAPFCAGLHKLGLTYGQVAAYLESTGKPRPSGMDPAGLSRLSRALETDAALRERVLATEVADG